MLNNPPLPMPNRHLGRHLGHHLGRHLGRCLRQLTLALGLGVAGGAAAQSFDDWLQATERMADDPRAALVALGERLLAGPSAEQRAWLHVTQARLLWTLEDQPEQLAQLRLAEAAVATLATPPALLARVLEQGRILAEFGQAEPQTLLLRAQALRQQAAQAGDPRLNCHLWDTELYLLVDGEHLDEAWLAAEKLESCGRELRQPHLVATALASMATILSRRSGEVQAASAPGAATPTALEYLLRAERELKDRPARFQLSLVVWDRANALRRARQLPQALEQVQRARSLSVELQDRAGIASADITIAGIRFDLEDWSGAVQAADAAIKALKGHDDGSRLVTAQILKLRALARSRHADTAAEIEVARGMDLPSLQPAARARLARAMAEAYAALQAWARAYTELQRAEQLHDRSRELRENTQVLRLQQRYDAIRRDAEVTQSRHERDRVKMELAREQAEQRVLVIALLLAALLAVVGLGVAARLWLRRRTYAALALRDDLTGSANRRAVQTYAQAQFDQARALRVPLTVALLDLDHFKAVNDRFGHAAGDEVLRAFVRVTEPVLRGQDRLGRWGGEEWLLVLPGTRVDELPRLFERIRDNYARATIAGLPQPHGQTFSMGGAALDASTGNLAALIHAADQQLYRAKAEGRNRLCIASTAAAPGTGDGA